MTGVHQPRNSDPFLAVSSSAEHLATSPPTGVRYRVLFVTFAAALLLYLDRFCMNFAQRYVKEDLRLSEAQIDSCMSAFFLAYGLAQVPTGGLTDRFGSRSMLAIYILAWSFFTAAMGWVGGFVALIAVRLAAGVSQAGAYPTSARVVGQWVPLAQRGVANSFIALGGRVGGALAPPLTAALVVASVPLSTSPLLTSDDILDPYALCVQLTSSSNARSSPESVALTDDQRAANDIADRVFQAIRGHSAQDQQQADAADLIQRVSEQAFEEQQRVNRETRLGNAAEVALPPFETREAELLVAELNHLLDQGVPADPTATGPHQAGERSQPAAGAQRLPHRRRTSPSSTGSFSKRCFPNRYASCTSTAGARSCSGTDWPAIFVAGWFFWQARDRAARHPRVNAAELSLIHAGVPEEECARDVRRRSVPRDPGQPHHVAAEHLRRRHQSRLGVPGLVAGSLPVHGPSGAVRRTRIHAVRPAVRRLGRNDARRLVDRPADASSRGIRIGRALPIAISRFIAMLAFALMLLHPSPWLCIALLAIVAFGTDLGSPAIWSVCQDVGGRSTAAVLGWGNMWGNLGAFVSPMLLGSVSRQWELGRRIPRLRGGVPGRRRRRGVHRRHAAGQVAPGAPCTPAHARRARHSPLAVSRAKRSAHGPFGNGASATSPRQCSIRISPVISPRLVRET